MPTPKGFMYEVICNDCGQHQLWENTQNVSSMIPLHCGACGSVNIKQVRFDAYWHDLAQHYGFEYSIKGAELIRDLYKLWEPAVFGTFKAFVEACKEDGILTGETKTEEVTS